MEASCWPISSSLPLTLWAAFDLTSHSLFLGTLFLASRFLLAAVSHFLCRLFLSWTFTYCGMWGHRLDFLCFPQPLMAGFFLFYGFTQQKSRKLSHVYLIWVWTYLIPHRYFVCNNFKDISYVTISKLKFGLPPRSLFYILVNSTTISLAVQAHKVKHFICKARSMRKPQQIPLHDEMSCDAQTVP